MTLTVCDVGPRDGLQNEPLALEPAVRAKLVDRLSQTGLPAIEIASFVNSTRVPQMAGAEDVAAAVERRPGTTYSGLVLNLQGYDRLRGCSLAEARFAFAISETFNRRNAGVGVEAAVLAARQVIARAHADGIRASITIGTAFGCPFEGPIDPSRVIALAERLADAGADDIIFADTIGVAVPRPVRELLRAAKRLPVRIGVHFHNTRNTGLANAYVAIEEGAEIIDASIGGIGGCPFAPRATGNIPTEDLVYMLHGEGIETAIDLDRLIDVAVWLEGVLGHQLPGQVYRAGDFVAV